MILDEVLLPFDEVLLPFDQVLLTFDQDALALEDRVEQLLTFKMLLAHPKVELRESLVLEAIPLAQESHHFVAGLAGG